MRLVKDDGGHYLEYPNARGGTDRQYISPELFEHIMEFGRNDPYSSPANCLEPFPLPPHCPRCNNTGLVTGHDLGGEYYRKCTTCQKLANTGLPPAKS